MKIVLFANTDWYLYNFRRPLALALREAGHEVLLLSPDGPYGERLRAAGLRWQPLPMDRRSLRPGREAALLRHLVTLFRRERPALVHSFTLKAVVYGALAARLARIPARINAIDGMGYVFTSLDLRARLLRPPVRTALRASLAGESSRLVLQNPDDVALFHEKRLIDPARIRLIPGVGVDCLRFASPSKEPASEAGRPLHVLLAARLLWDKGLAEYAEAARRLRAEGRAIEFLLAGDPDPGNPAAVPAEAVRAWADAGTLVWLGHVEDMSALLASVDVVALPSYREGLPTSLIEAAACARALVTTDAPGCREVVEDGVDGLRVPVRDAAALARAIARLHDDPALARRLGAAARAKALARFDKRIVVARTLAVYRELLPGFDAGPAADAGRAAAASP